LFFQSSAPGRYFFSTPFKLIRYLFKMRFSVAAAAILSATASVRAATFNVLVGANNNLTFNPTSLTGVANGDIVNFQFVSKNHSVVQSTFADPCTAAGVSSGYQNVTDPSGASGFPTWSLTVENASAPLWFFCSQVLNTTTHCKMGMVFAINPTAAKSFDMFQQAAIATNASAPAPNQNPSGTIINGSAGATDAALSASAIATESSLSAAPSATSSTSNGASQLMSGSSISLLAVAALISGLAL
jgi:plastocyanin